MAESCGIGFHRAAAANDHPAFVAMLADVVRRGPAVVKLARRRRRASPASRPPTGRWSWPRERGRPLELTLLEAVGPPRRHDPDRAPRRLPGRERPRLVPLREAVGARAVPPARARRPADRDRQPLPPRLRGLPRAAAPAARTASCSWRRPASGRSWPRRSSRWPGKLRMASTWSCRAAARADESLGGVRAPAARTRGARARRRSRWSAASTPPIPTTLSLGATMPRFLEMERRERSVILSLWRAARRAPRRARGDERRALVALRDVRGRHGGAGPPAGHAAASRRGAAQGAGGHRRAGRRRLARHHRGRRGLLRRRGDPVAGGAPDARGSCATSIPGSRICSRRFRTRPPPP